MNTDHILFLVFNLGYDSCCSEKCNTYFLSTVLVSVLFWLPSSSQFEISRFPYLKAKELEEYQAVRINKVGKAMSKDIRKCFELST